MRFDPRDHPAMPHFFADGVTKTHKRGAVRLLAGYLLAGMHLRLREISVFWLGISAFRP
jgi:hypothetical protein